VSLNFAVVVCAHDEARWNDLQRAVASLDRQTLQPAEIVVVVDHSPRLFALARERFADAIVVENGGRPGLGEARNTGVASSSAPVVAFLDDDAIASERWLALLAEPYADADVAGVGGSIRADWAGGRPQWFPAEFDWVVGCSYRGMPESVADVRNLLGCNMSFRREVVRELGQFQLGYGCDETELCIRLRQRWPSRRLTYVPAASVSHRVPAARGRFAYFVRRCFFEGGSKAVVSKLVGAADGLSTEVGYTRHVLPRAVRRGVADCVLRRDSNGIARACAVVAGLVVTATGYLIGHLTASRAARRRGWSGRRVVRHPRQTVTALTRP
jgi:GT2 family glycosyltransferase